jgi:hypothetical protein
VRSIVGIITTIAMVIHFTFGCCLHPCHGGGRGECVSHATEAFVCDACCDACDHEDATSEMDGVPCGHAEGVVAAITVTEHCHGCEGCHCAATSTETLATFLWSPLVSDMVARIDSEAIVLLALVGGRHPPDPHVRPRPHGQTLFERMLI